MLPGMDRKELSRFLSLAQVGLEMVVPVVIGLFLDQTLAWSPWGVIGGAVLGLAGGLVHLVRMSGDEPTGKDGAGHGVADRADPNSGSASDKPETR